MEIRCHRADPHWLTAGSCEGPPLSRVLFSFSLLEGEADGENAVVIVGVEVSRRDLVSSADANSSLAK